MLSCSMRELSNIETVRALYAAFGRGEIGGVLDRLDEMVVWITPGSGAIPTSGRRTGRDAVRSFFELLSQQLTFTVFEPREYIAQGNRVIALVHYEGRDNTTGRRFSAESAMLWTIGNGKAVRFQEYTDTEALAMAAQSAEAAHGVS